ncbi:helix-turn-helix domain-containing protein [Candidatus Burkholderia verschuerenii]|uniref:helix-turn-helix domain-containing protein n=1 Tax=Candidatus Burkholderia verschuerenii TaxID=242163 RepID=UPI000B055210|nr:helix-turn-helix domain-containing protein [Candidatus Burkholderia verschuerenii]
MTKTKQPSRLARELVEMTGAQRRLGLMDEVAFQKITARHLEENALPTAEPITAAAVREKTHLSQAAFARYLNMTRGYVSHLERA